ncbi:MAG TPA: hypothetical protein V6C81_10385 [Planktothrix sp.]|jgi:hypothetical protein
MKTNLALFAAIVGAVLFCALNAGSSYCAVPPTRNVHAYGQGGLDSDQFYASLSPPTQNARAYGTGNFDNDMFSERVSVPPPPAQTSQHSSGFAGGVANE